MTKSLSNKLYLKKQLYWLRSTKEPRCWHLIFNKVINELLALDIKIDEDKALILLSSLPQSYDHITTTMLYGKETFILWEVTSTLLSNEIGKRSNQEEQEGSSLVVMGGKGREGKKGLGSSKA